MFLWFKNYSERRTDTQDFLRQQAIRLNGLLEYTTENEVVSQKLVNLREKFTFAIAPEYCRALKPLKAQIESMYIQLRDTLAQENWDEREVIGIITKISVTLSEFNSVPT